MKWQDISENYIMMSFITCTLCQYDKNDQLEEDEIDRACSTNEDEEKCT
jgi:hypothetical protein